MSVRVFGLALSCLLAGCIAPYQPDPDHSVEVRSSYPMLTLNGEAVPTPYQIFTTPGEHRLQVEYQTYTVTPVCTFRWQAQADTRYEIVDSGDAQPLTLYRWAYVNGLWSRRTEPLLPESCE